MNMDEALEIVMANEIAKLKAENQKIKDDIKEIDQMNEETKNA
jgi:hypothetical protein